MAKEAKGFGLNDYDIKDSTYDVNKKQNQSEEDAIFLDIMGDDSIPLAQLAKSTSSKINKTRKSELFKAYKALHKTFGFQRGIPAKEKSIFYELLSTMLTAGIPLIQSVKVFTEQTQHKYFKKVTQSIAYQLEKGQSLSQAMGDYPKIFDEAETGMIESAEATGRLNEVLQRLSIEIENAILIRSKVKSAMIYPAIVFLFVIAALYGMLRFVIPQISGLFTETGLDLPGITVFLVNASNFVVNNSISILIGFLIILLSIYGLAKTPFGKKMFHSLFLKLPVLGDFQKAINQATFSRSISNLLAAGVSIVQAVEITARSIKNVIYKNKIELIAKDVSQGIGLADSIQDSPYFSNLMVSMIGVGEKTAQLDELSSKVADYYESKVENMAENFAKLIQPFIIAIVGGMVAVVVLSIMLPMTRLLGGIEAL